MLIKVDLGETSLISEKDNHNIVTYYENDVQKLEKYKYNIYILVEMLTPLDKWLTMNNLTVEQGIDIGLGVLLYYLFNKRRFPFYPDYPLEFTQEDEDRSFYKRMNYEIPKKPLWAPDGVAKIILKALERLETNAETNL